jgi:hypothetical protein
MMSAMDWLKRLFTRPIQIVDPTFGAMTLENGNWLALPDTDRQHSVILEGNVLGPSEPNQ